MNEEILNFNDLKALCNTLKVPLRTRKISYALWNTSHRAAVEYLEKYPIRTEVEN